MKFKPTPAFYSILLLLILWQALAMLIGYTDLFPSVTGLLKTIVTMLANPAFYVGFSRRFGCYRFASSFLEILFSSLGGGHALCSGYFHCFNRSALAFSPGIAGFYCFFYHVPYTVSEHAERTGTH